MLEKLVLKNYRGFRDHTVNFGKVSVVVGRNNAGKSTIIEALRLVSIVSVRARTLTFHEPPEWLDTPAGHRCVTPSLRGMDFDYRNLHYQYSDPPSIIRAFFDTGEEISIHLNSEEEELFAIIYRPDRKVVTSRTEVSNLSIDPIRIMPPIGTLAKKEKMLNVEYVQANLSTNLSPLHFRNQLVIYDELFAPFRSITENTWPHLQIRELNVERGEITLLVRDGRFVAEVGWVGQGLQSWLQTTWFLSRAGESDTVVFDEPDVYLHADLQRKLIRFLTNAYKQTIVATHSLEIISDVSPDNIVVVEKDGKASDAAPALPAVQSVMDNLGGAYNLQLMRLWTTKRCLFVEGKDMDFLDVFHSKLCPNSEMPLRSIPNIPLGGGGNWQHAVGAAIGLKNAGDEKIITYCILDRDYRTMDEVEEIETKAFAKGLDLVFWKRKEIENYALVPTAIRRLILKRKLKTGGDHPKIAVLVKRMDTICNALKEEIVDLISEEIFQRNKKGGVRNANRAARTLVEERWKTFEGRLGIVPAKKMFSELSRWSKRNYGVSFGAMAVSREITAEELDSEIADVIVAIEKSRKIPRTSTGR